ncbi:hypothetical protein ACOME3_004630 [Neoechinorhynchus agilis]
MSKCTNRRSKTLNKRIEHISGTVASATKNRRSTLKGDLQSKENNEQEVGLISLTADLLNSLLDPSTKRTYVMFGGENEGAFVIEDERSAQSTFEFKSIQATRLLLGLCVTGKNETLKLNNVIRKIVTVNQDKPIRLTSMSKTKGEIRRRFIQILALGSLRKEKVLVRIGRTTKKYASSLEEILSEISFKTDHLYNLKHQLFDEVDRDWEGYSKYEKYLVSKVLDNRGITGPPICVHPHKRNSSKPTASANSIRSTGSPFTKCLLESKRGDQTESNHDSISPPSTKRIAISKNNVPLQVDHHDQVTKTSCAASSTEHTEIFSTNSDSEKHSHSGPMDKETFLKRLESVSDETLRNDLIEYRELREYVVHISAQFAAMKRVFDVAKVGSQQRKLIAQEMSSRFRQIKVSFLSKKTRLMQLQVKFESNLDDLKEKKDLLAR